MRCENCRHFIKKLKCEISGDSMSRYDGCERGEYRETEEVVCKECKYFWDQNAAINILTEGLRMLAEIS